jgi:hypothetical protein
MLPGVGPISFWSERPSPAFADGAGKEIDDVPGSGVSMPGWVTPPWP